MTENLIELAKSVNYWDLLFFMTQSGWSVDRDQTSKFIVLYGPIDISNNPIEVVLFRNPSAERQPIYISNALDVLSSISNEEPVDLVNDINTVNRDVLRVRVQGKTIDRAIPLRTASQQIYELKQLVAYATRSEFDKKPYYVNAQHPTSKDMVDAYQFGHTFKGSFGFTIETPRLIEEHLYKQLSMFPDTIDEKLNLPLWRKVMERIAKGLMATDRATRTRNPKIIIDNYATGLNANMCQSLANMLLDESITIEYSVKWAAVRIPIDPELQSITPIQMGEAAKNNLMYAANELIETHQEETSISGRIIELSAKDSPMALDTSRTVRIQWFESAEGRTFEATATLSREDYDKAIEAHHFWYAIEITGLLSHKKNTWRFVSYSKFEVKPTIADR